MNKLVYSFSSYSKWLLACTVTIALLLILKSLTNLVVGIDQQNLSENNSPFTIQSRYLIDTENKSIDEVIASNEFIHSKLNKIPYALKQQSYWIKLTLDYPENEGSFPNYTNENKLILLAEHGMLDIFDVYTTGQFEQPQIIYQKALNVENKVHAMYPYATLTLNKYGHSEFLIHVKNSGAPKIPLLLFKLETFEQRLATSQIVYGAFIGVLLIMAVYNLVLFFAAKDKVYLFYIGYLLSAFLVLSSLTGYGHFIFSTSIAHNINQLMIFIDHFLISFLLLFTIYFLKYDKNSKKLSFIALVTVCIIIISAFCSLFLTEIIQTKLFFLMQGIFFVVAITLISLRIRHDFSWARFYFLSWIPLLLGAVIQPLVLLNQLEYSFFTRNAFLFAIMIEVTFMAFALAERIRRNEQEKLSMIAYHQNNLLPRKTNLDHTINLMMENSQSRFTVLVIKPEQFNRIVRYIDEKTANKFFQALNRKLSSLFRFNDAVLAITDQQEKLCFLESNCLAMVINNKANKQAIDVVLASIKGAVTSAFSLKGIQLPLTAQIGLANYPEHGNTSETLINNAYIAASHARYSTDKWDYFVELETKKNTSSMQLALDLNKAVKNQDFELFHQPQIDLKTGKVCSSECLIRWQHPVIGMITPDVFIPIAEDFGLMPSLTLWVVNTALQQQAQLREETGLNHMISINISGKDLIQDNFTNNISKIIETNNIKPEKIIFELTESISFANNDQAIRSVEQLIALGITISIDDFGTGYSSMAQISHLPFQELKIDRQFIENVCDDKKRKVIAETTVKMAKGLGLEVVAEGISSALDEETLRNFGCDIGQGFYYAKPMPIEDYIFWLNKLESGRAPMSLDGEFIPAKNSDYH